MNYGSINNSYSSGVFTGTWGTGGLCGHNAGSITNSSSNVTVIGGYASGGLSGFNIGGPVTNCSSFGHVTGDRAVGGLCGDNRNNIYYCHSEVMVTGNHSTGGLCGSNLYNSIQNSYASGDVKGDYATGGLLGGNDAGNSYVINCYSIGVVDGNDFTGGLCGKNVGIVTNSFWDVDTSKIGSSGDDNYGATGKTTAQMMAQSTFTGWDFTTPVWMMLRPGEDYPRLAWQEVFVGDIAGLYGVDMADFAYLANYWGQDCDSPACDRADIDTSGTIDLPDLAAVAADWLKGL